MNTYRKLLPDFRKVVYSRRGDDLSDKLYERRFYSLQGIKGSGGFKYYYLKIDGEVAAFRLGFEFKKIYFEWKSCHKSEFNKYSIGDLLTWMIVKNHIKNKLIAHNFMAGDYVYKERWATDSLTTINKKFIYFNDSYNSKFLKFYQKKVRNILKRIKNDSKKIINLI